jgi:thiol-disulfide isomerase/thioredoxin
MSFTRCTFIWGAAILVASQVGFAQTDAKAGPAGDQGVQTDAPEPAWLDRLDKTDRAILEESVGLAPAAIPADLTWVGGNPTAWNNLRGKVVLVQGFTTANSAGRSWPARLKKTLGEFNSSDVFVFAVHTPDGAAEAAEFLARKPPEVPVVIDTAGAFCDDLGFYKRPTNLLIDRQGVVRYVGLNERGVEAAVKQLAAEKFDAAKPAPTRGGETADETPSPKKADFPKPEGTVSGAADLRGKRAPDFFVQTWITDEPNARNKPVVIDFWATWCPPCIASIPHMNELASKFGDRAVFVGLSDEKEDKFEEGLRKKKLKVEGFKYSLALDPTSKMASAVKIQGIPHVMIVSSDWVVRWQGHPQSLNAMVLERIIKADEAMQAASGGDTGKSKGTTTNRNRWTKG